MYNRLGKSRYLANSCKRNLIDVILNVSLLFACETTRRAENLLLRIMRQRTLRCAFSMRGSMNGDGI